MKKNRKRRLACLIAVIMSFSMMSVPTAATENNTETSVPKLSENVQNTEEIQEDLDTGQEETREDETVKKIKSIENQETESEGEENNPEKEPVGTEIKEKEFYIVTDNTDVVYTGSEVAPKILHVRDELGDDVPESDYEITGSGVDVGDYTLTATGKGSYEGYTGTSEFSIVPKEIADCSRYLNTSTYTYTGKEICPKPIIKDGNKILKEGTDYTLAYSNHKNAGTGFVIIKGKGNYKNTINMSFLIMKANQSLKVKAGKTKITVKKSTTLKVSGNKGAVSFKSSNKSIATVNSKGKVTGKKPGTVTITVKAKGTSSYNPATASVKIQIEGYQLSRSKIKLSKNTYTYNGKAKKPKVKVKYKGKTLKKGRDYKISYQDNKNAGKAKVIIKGKGYYTGTVKKTFKIKKAKNNLKTSLKDKYIDINKTTEIKVKKHNGPVTFASGDNTVATVDKKGKITGKKYGTCKITVKAEGDKNHKSAKKTYTIRVGFKDLSDSKCEVILRQTEYTYTGKEIKPHVTVSYDGKKLTKGKDYTVKYKNNKNAGNGTITVKGKGRYRKSKSVTFKIKKTEQDFNVSVPDGHIAIGKETKIKVTDYYGTLSYETKDTDYLVHLGKGRFQGLRKTEDEKYAYITIKASGDKNHRKAEKKIAVQVY